jgi:uncharacterized protein YndB with AHSA1/START domain
MLSLKKTWDSDVQVVIDVPSDKVFSCMTDLKRHPEWLFVGLEAPGLEKTSEGPVGAGTIFKRMGYRWFGLLGWYPLDAVVTEYAPNERLAFEAGPLGGFRWRVSIHLEPEPAGGGTRVTKRRQLVRCAWWGWPLMAAGMVLFPVRPVVNHFYRRQLRGMGSRMEEYHQRPAL